MCLTFADPISTEPLEQQRPALLTQSGIKTSSLRHNSADLGIKPGLICISFSVERAVS